MKIGSKDKFSEVQARHWDQFAEAVGLSKAQARSVDSTAMAWLSKSCF